MDGELRTVNRMKKAARKTAVNDEPNLYLNGWRVGAGRAGLAPARFGSSSYQAGELP